MSDDSYNSEYEHGDRRCTITYQWDEDRGATVVIPRDLNLAIETWWQIADRPDNWIPADAWRLMLLPLHVERFSIQKVKIPGGRKTETLVRWIDEYHADEYDPARFRRTAQWRDHVIFDHHDPHDHIDTRWPQHAQPHDDSCKRGNACPRRRVA